jgi:hypothetical protein
MAYNNVFPMGYQPIGYQPQMQMQPQAQPQAQQQNGQMIWVQGETGAKSYLLTPNTTLPLWDSERQTIYLKSTDASGMPSMKVLDYTIRDNPQPQAPIQEPASMPDFVTHDEFKKFERDIKSQIRNLSKKEAKGDE